MPVISSLVLGSALLGLPKEPGLTGLKPKLDAVAKPFRGRLGYSVKLLRSGETIGFNEAQRFPSASTIKTVVMVECFRQIERGELRWDELLVVPPIGKRNASMWTAHLIEGTKVNVDGLIQLMMNVSDNTATVMLANRVGIDNIEKLMLSWGLQDTACTINTNKDKNLRLYRLRQMFANMGVSSPSDMSKVLEKIHNGTAASPAACQKMVRILSHQYWDDFIAWSIPPDVVVAAKVGALNRSRSDTAIVYGPRPYILTIYTDNQKDQRWVSDNEGDEAIRKISSLVWNHINPEKTYKPPKDAQKWKPTGGGVEDS